MKNPSHHHRSENFENYTFNPDSFDEDINPVIAGWAPPIPVYDGWLNRRVLIVESHPEAAGLLALKCDIIGCQSVIAHSREEALIIIQDTGIDLMIVDHFLPPMDGLALIERIRDLDINVPAILLLGKDERISLRRQAWLRIVGTLTKPISLREFRTMLALLWELPL